MKLNKLVVSILDRPENIRITSCFCFKLSYLNYIIYGQNSLKLLYQSVIFLRRLDTVIHKLHSSVVNYAGLKLT